MLAFNEGTQYPFNIEMLDKPRRGTQACLLLLIILERFHLKYRQGELKVHV